MCSSQASRGDGLTRGSECSARYREVGAFAIRRLMLLLAASVRRLLPEPVRGRAGPIRHAHSQEAPPATHGLLQCIGSLESRRGRRLAIPRHTSPRLAPYRLTREQAWAAATVPRARRRGPGECAPANPTAECLSESCSDSSIRRAIASLTASRAGTAARTTRSRSFSDPDHDHDPNQ